MQTPEQLKAAGNADFAAGRFAAAREHYTAAIALLDQRPSPGRELAVLYCNRAAAQLKLQHFAAALADSGAALAVQPRWAKALYRKAAALQGLGQLAPAAEAAQQALAAEPGNKDVQVLLRQLEAAAAAAAPAVAGAAAAADAAAAAGAAAAGPPADPSSPTKPDPTAALLPPLLAGAAFEYVPPADGIHENLLLLLHGLGDKPAAFGRMARQMALPQTAALALAGPQEVPFSDGGRSWHTVFDDEFNLIEGRPGEQRRVDSLLQTVAALRQLLTNLQHACGWQPHKVSLLGFSQGGTVALELARQQAAAGQLLRSCVAISAALLPEQLAGQPPKGGDRGAKQQGGTAVLITHGSRDNVVRRALVDQTADALRSAHGMSVSVHSVPGKAHSMPQGADEMRQLMQFWSQHLSRRPTAADLPGGAAAESGELLEVRPGEGGVSLELVGEAQ